jgi:outer membrane murein-binding lipoprotein Lpp
MRYRRRARTEERRQERYEEYLESAKWKEIRDGIWARDGKKCQACGQSAECVHHRSYSDAVMNGDVKQLHQLVSLCNSCHHEVEFDDAGSKIRDLAHKEQRLNSIMLSLRSQSLGSWSQKAMVGRDPSPRPKRREGKAPIRQVSTHDLLRRLESLTHDLSRLACEVRAVQEDLTAVRQRLSQIEEYEPSFRGFHDTGLGLTEI